MSLKNPENLKIYCVYPHKLIFNKKLNALKNISSALPHIKRTGFNALHLLPFMPSPRRDSGYDVSDYFSVDERFGSEKDFDELVFRAKQLGIRVFIDLICNHISVNSVLFKKAINGEEKFQDFFIRTKNKPHYVRTNRDKAHYIVDGQEIVIPISFPEFVGVIPHWEKFVDGHWYYHTFRRDQLDLNWKNKYVADYFYNVIKHWGRKGVSFRLDAAEFIGGKPYKDLKNELHVMENQKFLIQINGMIKNVNPNALLLIEAQGSERFYKKEVCDLVYDFKLCSYFWTALVLGRTELLNNYIGTVQRKHGLEFTLSILRTHDELNNNYMSVDDETTKNELEQILIEKEGNPRFQSENGVVGRLVSFLNNNVLRSKIAIFSLFMYPTGSQLVMYGDEFAVKNQKGNPYGKNQILFDTRNVHRNIVFVNEMTREQINFSESIRMIINFCSKFQTDYNFDSFYVTQPYVSGIVYRRSFSEMNKSENSLCHVLINFSTENSFRIVANTNINVLFHVNLATYNNENREITVGPNSGFVYTEKK